MEYYGKISGLFGENDHQKEKRILEKGLTSILIKELKRKKIGKIVYYVMAFPLKNNKIKFSGRIVSCRGWLKKKEIKEHLRGLFKKEMAFDFKNPSKTKKKEIEYMTLKELKEQIERLKEMAGDDEAAHSFEDTLRKRVLEEIAKGNPKGQKLAKEVLKTSKIRFARWCA